MARSKTAFHQKDGSLLVIDDLVSGNEMTVGPAEDNLGGLEIDATDITDFPDPGSNGILVRTGLDTLVARSVVTQVAAGNEGILVTNGSGVSGNIELGLEIVNLSTVTPALTHFVPYRGTSNNRKISFQGIYDLASTVASATPTLSNTVLGFQSGVAKVFTAQQVYDLINSLTAGTPILSSKVAGYLASAGAARSFTPQNIWDLLTSLTAKTTLVDADELPLADSAASNVAKKITWANLKAELIAELGLPQFAKITGDQTFSSATLANVTGLAFSVATGRVFTFCFNLIVQTSTAGEGPAFSLTFSNVARFTARVEVPTTVDGVDTIHVGEITSSGDEVQSPSMPAGSTDYVVRVYGTGYTTGGTCTVQLQAARETAANSIVVRAGSNVVWQDLGA